MAEKKLRKSAEKKLCGVCGGLAEYMDTDPTIIRLITVVLSLISFGTGLLVYLLAAVVMPGPEKKKLND